jgi:ketosteroid isomerase-like protein
MGATSPEEIHALVAAAFKAGDLAAFTALHEDHATALVPPDRRPVSGRDAIGAATAPTVARMRSFEVEVVEKVQAAGLALTHARWRATAIDGDEPVEMSGRGTVVSRRQPDGSWLIVLDNPMSPD